MSAFRLFSMRQRIQRLEKALDIGPAGRLLVTRVVYNDQDPTHEELVELVQEHHRLTPEQARQAVAEGIVDVLTIRVVYTPKDEDGPPRPAGPLAVALGVSSALDTGDGAIAPPSASHEHADAEELALRAEIGRLEARLVELLTARAAKGGVS